jgi:small GTP-binding protein
MKLQDRREIKIVIVGDNAIRKRCLLLSYYTNAFPRHIPKVIEEVSATVHHNEENVNIKISYYSGQEKFRNLSSFEEIEADFFIISFSLIKPSSLENVEFFWVKEIKKHYPHIPYILVGLQSDLRDHQVDEITIISTSQACEMMKKIEACNYIECSALNGYNLKEVFQTAISNVQNCQIGKIKQFYSYPGVNSEADCRVMCHVS